MAKLKLVGKPTPVKKYGQRYPWAFWFGRRAFVLTRGKEFLIQVHGMANMVRNRASKRRLSVALRIDEDAGTITVTVKGKKA